MTLRSDFGAVAQLGERYNGIVEVRGSIPLGSTIPLVSIKQADKRPGKHIPIEVRLPIRASTGANLCERGLARSRSRLRATPLVNAANWRF
jgi:hypothetical protein